MVSSTSYSLGLDFGTSSARALIVDTLDGRVVGSGIAPFRQGHGGVLSDPADPNVARQHPTDWLESLELAVTEAIRQALAADASFRAAQVLGIGIDATASTPLPVDADCVPLVVRAEFARDLNAHAWLWKDHTSHAEALEITFRAAETHPEYLAKCGGAYSSEWYFSKLLHALRVAPKVMLAAAGWLEEGDYLAGVLTGARSPGAVLRNTCAASHKAMYHPSWGFPTLEFLSSVDPLLGQWCRGRLPRQAHAADQKAGGLTTAWAERLGLRPDIPVAVAAIDAHVGAVGAGIRPGVLVKILGTSGCDMLVHPLEKPLADIPGICGIAEGSILPGHHGLEAGQSALGDIFGWLVREFARPAGLGHEALSAAAMELKPGESGLLALDWHNGNRCLLADPRLSGLLVGQTLHTRLPEVYRALLEATALGARAIMERFEEHRVPVTEVVACGGLAEKSPLLLQILADVTGRAIHTSRASETCALGAAIFGAVVGRAWPTVEAAARAMTGRKNTVARPRSAAKDVYDELFVLYRNLHDAFGVAGSNAHLHHVMKRLLTIRERARMGNGAVPGPMN